MLWRSLQQETIHPINMQTGPSLWRTRLVRILYLFREGFVAYPLLAR